MFYYLCRLVNTTVSLLYPLYSSYKVLRLPSSSVEQREGLERWCMFWSVMAGVWVWEEWGEWSLAWFPFYYEIKTLFILWLALPQVQGATYLYIHHLSPLLTTHEQDIDSFLSNLRSSALALGASYVQRALRSLRQAVFGQLLAEANADATANAANQPGLAAGVGRNTPPVLANPPVQGGAQNANGAAASTFANLAGGLMRQYGPAALAAGQALLHPMAGSPARPPTAAAAGGNSRRSNQGVRDQDSSASSSVSGHSGNNNEGLRDRSRTPSTASSGVPSALSPAGSGQSSPRDPVAQRYISSLAGSAYEEIGRGEVEDEFARGGGGRPSAARKSGSWFGGWGGQGEGVSGEKKDA
ncbi:hypothetical protein JCM11641_004558 [Rhodosporidiobolus odoratus]